MIFDDVRARDGSIESFHQGDFGLIRPEIGYVSSGQDTDSNGSHVEEQLGNGRCWGRYETKRDDDGRKHLHDHVSIFPTIQAMMA